MWKHLLYPRKCSICGEIIDSDLGICEECLDELDFCIKNTCIVCGKPRGKKEVFDDQGKCADCRKTHHIFIKNRSLFVYEDRMKQLVHELKYKNRKNRGSFFGALMAKEYGNWMKAVGIQGIVPIPLHPKRQKQRGYNQATLMAKELSKRTGIPVLEDLLLREKETIPQKELTDEQRKNNMKNAFHIKKNAVQLNCIMLLDDIYTTGATMDAAAKACKSSGIKNIYCITACIGRGY